MVRFHIGMFMQNNGFFSIFKSHLLEIINLFKNVLNRINSVTRFLSLVFFILLVFAYISVSFIIFLINIFYLTILFLYKYFYIRNNHIDNEFIINAEPKFNFFKNDILIYLKIIFIDTPLNYSFLYFYNFLSFFTINKKKNKINLTFIYNVIIGFILKRIILIFTTFTYLNLKLAFSLFISFFDLFSYQREDFYAFLSHLLFDVSSNLLWSVNNDIIGKKIHITKNNVFLNGFSWENFFKTMENHVGKKSLQNYYNNCMRLKSESKLVYGITTDTEKTPHAKLKLDIILNNADEFDDLLKKIDYENKETLKKLSYNTQKQDVRNSFYEDSERFEKFNFTSNTSVLSNNATTNPNFYLKGPQNTIIKNTGPFEGTINSNCDEFLTPAQLTNKSDFKLSRMPVSMAQNINKIDYKSRYFATLMYDIQTHRIFEFDGKEFKELPLNVFLNKLDTFNNDSASSAIHETIDFSQRLSLSCESVEERDFYLKNVYQAIANPQLSQYFKKISITSYFNEDE